MPARPSGQRSPVPYLVAALLTFLAVGGASGYLLARSGLPRWAALAVTLAYLLLGAVLSVVAFARYGGRRGP